MAKTIYLVNVIDGENLSTNTTPFTNEDEATDKFVILVRNLIESDDNPLSQDDIDEFIKDRTAIDVKNKVAVQLDKIIIEDCDEYDGMTEVELSSGEIVKVRPVYDCEVGDIIEVFQDGEYIGQLNGNIDFDDEESIEHFKKLIEELALY